MTGFSKWWFLRGGSIHGLWKRRQYSEIKRLAETLPKAAYEQGCADTIEKIATQLEQEYAEGQIASKEHEWNRLQAKKIRTLLGNAEK